jgi:hypothetical protein
MGKLPKVAARQAATKEFEQEQTEKTEAEEYCQRCAILRNLKVGVGQAATEEFEQEQTEKTEAEENCQRRAILRNRKGAAGRAATEEELAAKERKNRKGEHHKLLSPWSLRCKPSPPRNAAKA